VNPDDVIGRLHSVPPPDFVAARNEKATEASDAGDKVLAQRIRKLRRPSRSAWAVNVLARENPEELTPLIELGEELRGAQRSLSGDRLRALAAERRELVSDLRARISRLAAERNQPLNAHAETEVEQTLEAALADSDAADSVVSGQLSSALRHFGFGEEEPDSTRSARRGGGGGSTRSRGVTPSQAVQDAEAKVEEARRRAKLQSTHVREAETDARRAEREVDRIGAELHNAEQAASRSRRKLADAREALSRARGETSVAEDRLEALRAKQRKRPSN
jgi:hypothetical protein